MFGMSGARCVKEEACELPNCAETPSGREEEEDDAIRDVEILSEAAEAPDTSIFNPPTCSSEVAACFRTGGRSASRLQVKTALKSVLAIVSVLAMCVLLAALAESSELVPKTKEALQSDVASGDVNAGVYKMYSW